MAEASYTVKRANPRFSFFADAEVTLRDGTGVRGQLAELSSRGCYIDTLEPIPIRTKLRLRICDGMSTCELACCLKRWVPSNTPQSARGCANSQGVPGKTWERTPFLKSQAKSQRINGPRCNQACS